MRLPPLCRRDVSHHGNGRRCHLVHLFAQRRDARTIRRHALRDFPYIIIGHARRGRIARNGRDKITIFTSSEKAEAFAAVMATVTTKTVVKRQTGFQARPAPIRAWMSTDAMDLDLRLSILMDMG